MKTWLLALMLAAPSGAAPVNAVDNLRSLDGVMLGKVVLKTWPQSPEVTGYRYEDGIFELTQTTVEERQEFDGDRQIQRKRRREKVFFADGKTAALTKMRHTEEIDWRATDIADAAGLPRVAERVSELALTAFNGASLPEIFKKAKESSGLHSARVSVMSTNSDGDPRDRTDSQEGFRVWTSRTSKEDDVWRQESESCLFAPDGRPIRADHQLYRNVVTEKESAPTGEDRRYFTDLLAAYTAALKP